MAVIGPIVLKDVQLLSTKKLDINESAYNKRNVGLVLSSTQAEYFKDNGWNIGSVVKEDGTVWETLYCDVEPSWNPEITVINEDGSTTPVTTVEDLDAMARRIDKSAADISILGYIGKNGNITAKVKSFRFRLAKEKELVHITTTRNGLGGYSPIKFSNFAGKEHSGNGFNNRAGYRSCSIYIENEEQALALKELGWNIKIEEPYREGAMTRYYTSITVDFEHQPTPIIKRFRDDMDDIPYDKDMMEDLDEDVRNQNIEAIDIYLYPRRNKMATEYLYKGYLRELTFVFNPDPFSENYIIR